MKREKFLWSLTQGHHGALVGARNIRNRLVSVGVNETHSLLKLSEEVSLFFEYDLSEHFRGEEDEVLRLFEAHAGPGDADLLKIRKDHEAIELLAKALTKNELQLFADTLTAHIRFEEDIFFPRVEAALTDEEKNILAERLPAYKPGASYCPLPA